MADQTQAARPAQAQPICKKLIKNLLYVLLDSQILLVVFRHHGTATKTQTTFITS